MATSSKPRVASLFSGCGGSSMGYKMAGFEVVYANEFVPAARETYAANFPATFVDDRDVRKIKPEDLPDIDVLDGSPPCVAFSSARRNYGSTFGKVRKYSDTEQRTDDLFDEYIRILRGKMPKVFVAENVMGLSRGPAKGYFLHIMSELEASGYVVDVRALDASYLGVPQQRQRLIFQGVRKDLGLAPCYPTPSKRQTSVEEKLPHIAKVKHGNLMQYRSAALPCGTITVAGYNTPEVWTFSSGNFVITRDGEKRRWTIEELKVVFGFPPEFVLTGTQEQQWERLGRSVPPPMMAAVASAIRDGVLAKLPCAA